MSRELIMICNEMKGEGVVDMVWYIEGIAVV